MQLINNIDVVRLNVTTNRLIYFPYNSNFKDRKVSRILFVNTPTFDPVINKDVITDLTNVYLTVRGKDNNFICNDINVATSIANLNNYDVSINAVINPEISFIRLKNQIVEGEILMYVIYDTTFTNDISYSSVIELDIPAAGQYSLDEFIDSPYFGKLIQCAIVPGENTDNNNFIELYDKDGRNCGLMSQQLFVDAINNPIIFNNLNIDYQRSLIYASSPFRLQLYFLK